MVLKVYKYGARTGNTIRAVNTRYTRRYRTDAFILRRDALLRNDAHDDAQLPEVYPGLDIPVENIPFSLNKQQRWLLPDIIKECMGDCADNIHVINNKPTLYENGLELVTRKKLCRNNNVMDIDTYKEDEGYKKYRTGTIYMDADNILNTCPVYSRKTRARVFLINYPNTDIDACGGVYSNDNVNSDKQDGNTTASERETSKDDKVAPVRYEVIVPCDSPFCMFPPKRLGQNTTKTFSGVGECGSRKPWTLTGYKFSRSVQKKTRWEREEIKEAINSYHADDDEYFYADFDDTEDGFDEEWKEVLVDEQLDELQDGKATTKTEPEHDLKTRKQSRDKPIKPETTVANIPTPDAVNTEVDEEFCKHTLLDVDMKEDIVIQYERVPVLLSIEESSVSVLEQKYGTDYMECNCSPRRFVINVSSYIDNLDGVGSAFKLIQIHDRRTLAWLVFERITLHEANNSVQEVFNVHLNANFGKDVAKFKLEGIPRNSIVNIQDIIGQCLTKIKSMSTYTIVFETPPKLPKHEKPIRILEEMNKWTSHSYYPDNAFLLKHLADKHQYVCPSNAPGQHRTSSSGDFITLLSCKHSSCRTCWRKHVYSLVRSGNTRLKCLYDACNDVIGLGMLISIVDVRTILHYSRLCHNETVQQNTLTNWCSNDACGRVVVVDDDTALFARCECGQTMCVKCRGKSHWPMTCEEYKLYAKLLSQSRDLDKEPREFVMKYKTKFCIYCYRNTSYNDTCSRTICMCENRLCSCCSDLIHTMGAEEGQPVYLTEPPVNDELSNQGTNAQTIHLKMNSKDCLINAPSKHYKLALKHRIAQHPFRVAKIRACSKLLAKRIKRYILQEDLKRTYVYLDFAEDVGRIRRESEKVVLYFEYLVDLYIDVNNIVECFSVRQNFRSHTNKNSVSTSGNASSTKMTTSCNGGSSKKTTSGEQSLHRRIMTVSLCGQELCDLFKNGAFMNPGTVVEKLKSLRKEIKRVLKQLSTIT